MKKKTNKFRYIAALMSAALMFTSVPVYAAQDSTQSDSSSVLAEVESRFEVTIPKTLEMIVDSDWHGTASYQASVTGDIEVGTSVYVVPQQRFNMTNTTDTLQQDVTTTVTQDKVEWTCEDLLAADTKWGNGSLSGDGFAPGNSEGIFYFNIQKDESGKTIDAPGDKIIDADFVDQVDPVDAGTYQMGAGQTASISMQYNGKDVTNETTYSSDNERITVDENGKVDTSNAVGGDEATITATYTETVTTASIRNGLLNPMATATGFTTIDKTLTAQFHIQVIGIRFDKESIVARPGDTVVVTADILPGSVTGTVKWTLNGLDFGTTGNEITINIADNATTGNYTLVASYNGTVETLIIKVSNGPEVSGVVDGGQYTGPVEITVDEGSTVIVDGNSVIVVDNKFTVSGDGQHIITVSKDGMEFTYNITIQHEHAYVDGFCSICGREDASLFSEPGLYTASGRKLATWTVLTEDYGLDLSADRTSSNYSDTGSVKAICESTSLNPDSVNYIIIAPDTVTKIGSYCFYKNTKLKKLVANGVITYGEYSFANSSIGSTYVSSFNNANIGENAFEGCKFTEFSLVGSEAASNAFNKCSFSNVVVSNSTIATRAFNSVTITGTLVVSGSTLKSNAVQNATVSNMEFNGSNVAESGAFYSIYGITDLTLKGFTNELSEYSDGYVCKMHDLKTLTYDCTTTLKVSCDTLEKLTIGPSVTGIDVMKYEVCKLKEVVSDNENFIVENGILYNKDKTIIYFMTNDSMVSNFKIPNTVTDIKSGAFSYCKNLKQINYNNGKINEVGYAECKYSGLTSIVLPDKVEIIWSQAFMGCSDLKYVDCGNKLRTINSEAFQSCKNLTAIWVPNTLYSVKSDKWIGSGYRDAYDVAPFYGCDSVVIYTNLTKASSGFSSYWNLNGNSGGGLNGSPNSPRYATVQWGKTHADFDAAISNIQ